MLYFSVDIDDDACEFALAGGMGNEIDAGCSAVLLTGYAKTDLLILDDWGLAPFTAAQWWATPELLNDRYGNSSTLVTSQMSGGQMACVDRRSGLG